MLAKLTKDHSTGQLSVASPEEIGFQEFVQRLLGTQGKESHLEELVRFNVELLFGNDVSALIVGQQV